MNYDFESPYNWESNQNLSKNLIYKEWINKIFNYSAEDLINLMVTLLKEQKVGYPIGYSKNWRDVYAPKLEMPIIEFDEVEYDTKKGRKKGIAEFVLNSNGERILKDFYNNVGYSYSNNEIDKENLDNIIKKEKLSIKFDTDNYSENEENESFLKDLAKLMRILIKENPNSILGVESLSQSWIRPVKLDIGEIEEIPIKEKNIKRIVPKGEEEKEVKPTKYPEPFKWGSKDFKENIIEISEYREFRKINANVEDVALDMSLPINEQQNWGRKYYYECSYFESIIIGYDKVSKVIESNISDTWVAFEYKFARTFGLFYGQNRQVYSNGIVKDLAEFRVTQKQKFEPMGITSANDIQIKIDESKEKINSLKIEKQELDTQQVFDELVQETRRKQEELNAEEIRAGSSYLARVKNFAESNPDYLGNKMLDVFNNTPIEELKDIQKQYRPSDRAIKKALEDAGKFVPTEVEEVKEVEIVVDDTQSSDIEILIEDLKESLMFLDGDDLKNTESLIEDLEEAMLFS
jgi:hypothetical protein